MQPSAEVLAAFGLRGIPTLLHGGQGASWRCGEVVLKPLDMPVAGLVWLDEVARPAVASSPLRMSLPLASRSGELVVDGWTAFPYLEGEPPSERWEEVADVARSFAGAFSGMPRPSFIADRTDPWARADRLAWGEEEVHLPAGAALIHELLAARRDVNDAPTLIHGDLASNVLLADDQPPAVIDLTLYWRPVEYSVAIVAVDAVCFRDAPLAIFATISDHPRFEQYLVRALIFRMLTDLLRGLNEEAPYRRVAEAIRML